MSKKLLNMHKDLEKKKQADLMERGNKFLDEYKELCRKYKMDLCAELEATREGIKPVIRVRPLTEETKLKPWSEAKRDNLENHSKCEHERVIAKEATKEEVERARCVKCGLISPNWADKGEVEVDSTTTKITGKGVTDEYRQRTEAQIKALAEEEKERDAEQAADEQTTEDSENEEEKAA